MSLKADCRKICLVIGSPIKHSFSPLVHNVALKALGLEQSYVFSASEVKVEDLERAVLGMRSLGIYEFSCTIPHKEKIIPFLDSLDGGAKEIGAANTVINRDGELIGYNTDLVGAIQPFLRRTTLTKKRVLLLGAGGAARAVAYGFAKAGSNLTITNRTFEKAQKLALELNAQTLPWDEREAEVKNFDIIFNATSVGLTIIDDSPLSVSAFRAGQIVCDAIYNPYETTFLRNAKARGCDVIYGTEMFIEQAAQQILLYAGVEAPRKIMEKALMERLCQN